jgi:hypothetical protein
MHSKPSCIKWWMIKDVRESEVNVGYFKVPFQRVPDDNMEEHKKALSLLSLCKQIKKKAPKYKQFHSVLPHLCCI